MEPGLTMKYEWKESIYEFSTVFVSFSYFMGKQAEITVT